MYTVAIIAGGLASRMLPLTEKIPKSLLSVNGKPFIHWQLDYLSKQGIDKVVICTGFLGEQIEDSVGDGKKFGLEVVYSNDGPSLLGTGGSLKQALPHLGEHFFVLYGDSFLPINFHDVQLFYESLGESALMTVFKNNGQWDKSNVYYEKDRIILYDKKSQLEAMQFIDYGLGILSAEVFVPFKNKGYLDLADVYNNLSKAGRLAGYEVFERFYEIGSHEGLKEAHFFLEGV